MRTKTTFTLVALAAGVLAAAEAPDAMAKGKGRGRKNRGETVRLATPAQGPTTNAKGTITITPTRGAEDAVLRLRGLARRATYEVVNGVTGATLGQVRTDRKGRATFDLTPGVGGRGKRAASAGGEEGTEVPEVVEVVDPETGDVVLTGDTTGEIQALYGYATLGNATESLTITMGSDPYADMEYLSFTYFAPPTDDGWIVPVFEFWADTATGGLPLGAESVLNLAGRDFQVRDADGNVVFRGALPDVEAYEIPELPDCPSEPPVPEFPDDGSWGDWNGRPGGEIPFAFDGWMDWGADEFAGVVLGGFFGGGNGRMGKRADPSDPNDPGTEPPRDETVYTLWIEGADGFERAGDLVAPQICPFAGEDPWSGEVPGDDGPDWFWDWDQSGEWNAPPAEDPATSGANTRRR